ncbi:MAG: pyridoxal-phosphate dependent enzyme [Acidobacteria bacterium]|nr:pyridoxal-phosphate dependent enzyme [Acidobacteriota bacterium]
MAAFRLVCAACGTSVSASGVAPPPFRCPSAGALPDADHVVTKLLGDTAPPWPAGGENNPFVRYRTLLLSYDVARTAGASDADYVERVERLDSAVATVAGHGFRVTPFSRHAALSDALGFSPRGGVWVKDETGNVSGSHKGRHLAGIMLHLVANKWDSHTFPGADQREKCDCPTYSLAIASCGNAALAAAVVARAAGWTLHAFIPPDADPGVVERLRDLGASLVVCPRRPGEIGDPCYLRFKEALAEGALPFCCQGPDNGLTIEGGETLAYEMIDQAGGTELDGLVVQVGGGALASACIQGFDRAVALGRLRRGPRIYTMQTRAAAPLARAYERVAGRAHCTGLDEAVRYAATHRPEFMWPWESEPRSIAHGILDDETYDWLAVVRGMLESGGRPVVVDEATLVAANACARETTGINVDHTGSAGLAGLFDLRARGVITAEANIAVIFSGIRR